MGKKILIGLFIVVLAGAGIYFYLSSKAAKAAELAMADLKTAVLEVGTLETTISATGNVRSRQQVDLTWSSVGIVEDVKVKLGDSVPAGSQLATLAQSSLPQTVILAQADLFSAQEALDNLYTNAEDSVTLAMNNISDYQQAARDAQFQLDNFTIPSNQKDLDTIEAVRIMNDRLEAARQNFEPYKYYPSTDSTREDLLEKLNEAQADFDAALKRLNYEYALEIAQTNLNKAIQDYEKWKAGPNPAEVEAIQAKISAAEATIKQAWIETPFSGMVTRLDPKPGDKVTAGQVAARIDDFSAMYVDVSVSEVDIDLIEVGQPAVISFDALRGKEFMGEVVEVAPVSEISTSTVNFSVTIQLTDPAANVRPGMTAVVDIIIVAWSLALLIPNQAVRTIDGLQTIYLKQPGEAMTPIEVTLGASSETFSELTSGEVKAGDTIVLNPPDTNSEEDFSPFMMGARRQRENGEESGPPPGPQQ